MALEFELPKSRYLINTKELSASIVWSSENWTKLQSLLGVRGNAQRFFDRYVMDGMEPYMQLLTGRMIGSMYLSTVIGDGEIVVNVPYAERQHERGRPPGMSLYGPLRGLKYFPRWKANHMDEAVTALSNYVRERMNK